MEVKRDYGTIKLIPANWEIRKLGEVAYITKLAGFEYTNYFNSYKDGGDIIVIRGTNITKNKLDLSDVRAIPSSTSNKLPRSKLNKDDLVFAYVGTIGPVYLVKEDDKFHLGPNTSKISAGDLINPHFLFYYFTSWLILNEIIEYTSVGAQPSLSMSKIRKFKIILPTLPEQTAIANALSDVDTSISSMEKLITKKRNIKQGAMQLLLTGKKRLPGFSGDWKMKSLGEIFSISAGGDLLKGSFSPIKDNVYCYPIYSNSLSNKGLYGFTKIYRHDENCVTVTARGTIGVANARDHKFDAIGRVLVLKPMRNLNCFFVSEYLNNRVSFSIESTGVPQLTAPQISKYEIGFPEPDEQTAIAQIFIDMDTEIEAVERKLAKCHLTKQGMMQELLTGKKRLI